MTDPTRAAYDAVAAAYDAVAAEYEKQIAAELEHKPLDRALLAALAELAGPDGIVADVGCGPGHVAAYLAGLGVPTLGVDLSPAMVDIARTRGPAVVGSMLDLPAGDGAWAGAVLMYSIIHLSGEQRARVFRELARVIRPGGPVLVAFHVSDAEHAPGDTLDADEFLGMRVELVHHFLPPDEVGAGLASAGFAEVARLEREPDPPVEYRSRRCYLIARRAGH